MKCDNGYFNGWGSCASLLEMMNGAAIQKKGNVWTDAEIIALSNWQTAIADDDSTVRDTLMLPVLSFVNTTNEVEILESPLGKKSLGTKPTPSGIIYLDASICDYNHLHALEDTWFEIIPFFQGNKFWTTRKTDESLKGFRFKLGTVVGMPPEDKNTSFGMHIFFDSYAEFERIVVTSPDFIYTDLFDFSPAGLEVLVTAAYSSSVITFKVTKRGSGDPMLGLTEVGDFEVLKSNATPVVAATVVVDNGLGSYTVTFKKDSAGTPADLSATDQVTLQIHDDDATHVTFLSNAFKFNGGT